MPMPDAAQRPPPLRSVRTAGGAVLVAASAGIMALLAQWEPDKRDPGLVYADQLAGGLPTVCMGITRHITQTPVVVGERWSADKCQREEAQAVLQVQQQLARCFTRPDVPQAVFDAASSHAWNNGASATCSSQAMRAFNAGEWSLGCRRLGLSDAGRPVWSFVRNPDGTMRYVQGLANRRASETSYCRRGLQP